MSYSFDNNKNNKFSSSASNDNNAIDRWREYRKAKYQKRFRKCSALVGGSGSDRIGSLDKHPDDYTKKHDLHLPIPVIFLDAIDEFAIINDCELRTDAIIQLLELGFRVIEEDAKVQNSETVQELSRQFKNGQIVDWMRTLNRTQIEALNAIVQVEYEDRRKGVKRNIREFDEKLCDYHKQNNTQQDQDHQDQENKYVFTTTASPRWTEYQQKLDQERICQKQQQDQSQITEEADKNNQQDHAYRE